MSKTLIYSRTQQGGGGLQSSNNNCFGPMVKNLIELCNSSIKLLAFTLAETLIVIGIIGVVASLTIPNLNSTTADKEKIARAKKAYAQINEAFERAQAVYGPFEEWNVEQDYSGDQQTFEKLGRIFEFTKLSKECKVFPSDSVNPCINIDVHSSFEDGFTYTGYSVILADGTGVMISVEDHLGCIIDIDGPAKGKNKAGIDQFLFHLDRENNPNYKSDQEKMTGDLNLYPGTKASNNGEYQSSLYLEWILKNDNMDFTKVDSSYNCPDGSPLNWETKTSCK